MSKINRTSVVVVFTTLAAVIAAAILFARKFSLWPSHRLDDGSSLICHVELTLMSLENQGREESYECVVVSAQEAEVIYDFNIGIDLPADFIAEHKLALDAGELYIQIPGGEVEHVDIEGFGLVGTNVYIPEDSEISVLGYSQVSSMKHHRRKARRRGLEEVVGQKEVMVFRITTDDASPEISATEIGERMFSPTEFSFAAQFEKCSFGELTFESYDRRSPVAELYVPGGVASFTERTILNAATRQAAHVYGSDIWDRIDHAIFCMPDGTSGKPYIAYSGVGSFFSVYHNLRCAYPTTVMHEISHNCGLGHAFEDGEEYGDETSIMGFSSSSKTGPSKCFNGQNIHHFGWFKDRSVVVDPFQGQHIVELSPFVDYNQAFSYQAVLITVYDMHIVYNRAKGFNAETSEYQDKVTVTKDENEINSELLAILDVDNPTFTVPRYLGTDKTLYIEICDSVAGSTRMGEADYVLMSIGFDFDMCPRSGENNIHTGSFALLTGTPTQFPTPQPTPQPSSQPVTPWPTSMPTFSPSAEPTDTPTFLPFTSHSHAVYIVDQSVEQPEQSQSEPLPEIDLVPYDPEAEAFKKTEAPEERPPIIVSSAVSSAVTTLSPTSTGETNNSFEDAIARMQSEPNTAALGFLVVCLVLFVVCCAFAGLRWNQRRMDERKRNLHILQYGEGARQVKLYWQDPV